MKNECQLLHDVLMGTVDVSLLSCSHDVSDIREAEALGLLQRDPVRGRRFFTLTSSGRDRLLFLLDQERSAHQHTQENAQAKADQECQRVQNQFEQAKADKKIGRRSWCQTVFALIAAPLITLFIEHFDAVSNWFSRMYASFLSLFH